jgi:nucleoside-diphosphate-sugar epimerase
MGTRIMVAGATGTLGRPLVAALVDAGHEVVGLTRTAAKERAIERLGARPVVADALHAEALLRAVHEAAPEVVVHLLTALPTGGPTKASDFVATNRLRRIGTGNLLAAATAAGVRRLVAESVVYALGFGDHGKVPLTEIAPLRPPGRAEAELVSAARALEQQVVDASRREEIEGIVLRYGLLYGAETGSTQAMADMLRKRRMPLIGNGDGVASWIHVSDAVRATVTAINRGRPGELYHRRRSARGLARLPAAHGAHRRRASATGTAGMARPGGRAVRSPVHDDPSARGQRQGATPARLGTGPAHLPGWTRGTGRDRVTVTGGT